MFFLRGGAYGNTPCRPGRRDPYRRHHDTVEGNTNDDDSANGYEVARRVRRIASSDFGLA